MATTPPPDPLDRLESVLEALAAELERALPLGYVYCLGVGKPFDGPGQARLVANPEAPPEAVAAVLEALGERYRRLIAPPPVPGPCHFCGVSPAPYPVRLPPRRPTRLPSLGDLVFACEACYLKPLGAPD
jgi:hypothetical protein